MQTSVPLVRIQDANSHLIIVIDPINPPPYTQITLPQVIPTVTFQNSHVRFYVSLIGSGEGRHTTHLLKCVLLLSTSQTDWKQSSDILSDISFDIHSDISFDILSNISFESLPDISSDIFLTFFLHIFWLSFWEIFWHIFCKSSWHIF